MTSESLQTLCQICVAIGITLTAIGGYGAYHFGQKIEKQKDAKTTTTGVLLFPQNKVPEKDNITVMIGGGFICDIPRTSFKEGGVLANGCVNINNYEPIIIKIKNDNLYINTKIYDIDGKIVGEIIDNIWNVNPNCLYKRSFNDNSLEIIDNYNIPVLQIRFIDNNVIWLGGALSSPSTVIFAYENEVTSMRKDPEAVKYFTDTLHRTVQDIYFERARKLNRIFND